MTQDEFIKRYCILNHAQKQVITNFISSFQTAQTYHPQEDVAPEKDDYISSTEQLLQIGDCPHQKDN